MNLKRLFPLTLCVAAFSAPGPAAFAAAAQPAAAPLRILFVAGGCCHDYANQPALLKKGLEERANVRVDIATSASNGTSLTHELYNSPDWARNYDLVIHDECSAGITDMTVINNALAPHIAGIPAVFLHCSMHSYRTTGWNTGGVTPWFEITGLQSTGHGAQLPIALNFVDKENDITRGMANWTTINEELYNNYAGGVLPSARPLVLGKQGADETVVVWTNVYRQKTRVFATTLGHNNATVEDPRYLDLVTRGTLWAADKLTDAWLKPVAPAAQKQALISEPREEREPASVEAPGCGCADGEITLALAH